MSLSLVDPLIRRHCAVVFILMMSSMCKNEQRFSISEHVCGYDKGKGTLQVTYTVYSEIWSLHLTHPGGTVGSHSTTLGDQLQIVSQFLGPGC